MIFMAKKILQLRKANSVKKQKLGLQSIENQKGILGLIFSIAALGICLRAPFFAIAFSIAGIALSALQMKEKRLMISRIAIILSIAALALATILMIYLVLFAAQQASIYYA